MWGGSVCLVFVQFDVTLAKKDTRFFVLEPSLIVVIGDIASLNTTGGLVEVQR